MSWKDSEIDKLYQENSENLSFEYKKDYWKELDDMLPISESVAPELNDSDLSIDELYREKSKELAFEYKASYWQEMVDMLGNRRKRDFLWYFTSVLFMGLLSLTQFNGANGTDIMVSSVETGKTLSEYRSFDKLITTQESKTTEMIEQKVVSSNQVAEQKGTNSATLSKDVKSNSTDSASNSELEKTGTLQTEEAGINTEVESEVPQIEQEYKATYNTIPLLVQPEVKNDDVSLVDESASEINIINEDRDIIASDNVNSLLIISDLNTRKIEEVQIEKSLIDIQYDLKMPSSTRLYVEVNGGLSQSLISPSDKFSYSYGAGFGVQFQKGRVLLNAGINGIVSNHEDIELSRQAKVYGFGSDVYNYSLNYKQLYSMEASLSIGFKMGAHTLSVGCRPSYVFGTKVAYSTGEEGTDTRQTVYGHMDGISRFGLKPMLGYVVSISPSISVGMNVGMQLMQSVNEANVNGINNKMPIDGQIYLRKTIRFRR